jgi:hypothetical protein
MTCKYRYKATASSKARLIVTSQRNLPLMTPFDTSNAVCYYDAERTKRNPSMCTGDANTQAAGVAVYQIGCFFGAILILFYGESWGRKSSTFWGVSKSAPSSVLPLTDV